MPTNEVHVKAKSVNYILA